MNNIDQQIRKANVSKADGMLRINELGMYQLTSEFVAQASTPERLFETGFGFNVTKTAFEDSVVYIPEFGGWTYCEIPAKKVETESNQYDVRFRIGNFWSNTTVEAGSARAAAENVLKSPVFSTGKQDVETSWSSVNSFGGEAVVKNVIN